ncbi:ParB/RepB/Spo0J family partition protein [Actinocorallia longicatena]
MVDLERQPVVEVEIGSLSVEGSPRSTGEDPDHVAALLGVDVTLPPILVHRATMRVIDGRHRLRAALLLGRTVIEARFFDGDEAEAFVLAVRVNVAHGLPLALADRKHAAERIVASHPHWSDRMIASVSGISAGTVAELRARSGDSGREESRVGRDGRVRPVTGAERRRRAGEIIRANPDYSLRQIAREAGISPETARDVKNRLLRGEDPVPARRGGSAVRDEAVAPPRPPVETVGPPAGRTPGRDWTAVVERLKADPSLRFSEKGRDLLRLLALHTATADAWDDLIDSVPVHCGPVVAYLAGDFARLWTDLATGVELNIPETG